MRIVKSVLLEKKSEAYYFLRIWIAVSNYVLFTLITNEKCWLYDLLFHGWKLDLFFVKGKMRVPIPPIFDFTNFSKKRFLNKYFFISPSFLILLIRCTNSWLPCQVLWQNHNHNSFSDVFLDSRPKWGPNPLRK